MNQRSGNGSRNPAMPFGQLVERRNGRRIAQNHGDLAATRGAFRFALGAGLGSGHSEQPEFTASHVSHDDDALGTDGKDRVLQYASIAGVHGCGNRVGVFVMFGTELPLHGHGSDLRRLRTGELGQFGGNADSPRCLILCKCQRLRLCVAVELPRFGCGRLDGVLAQRLRPAGVAARNRLQRELATCHAKQAGSDLGGGHRLNVHLHLRSGPIPPMCESYIVTSNLSTGICT